MNPSSNNPSARSSASARRSAGVRRNAGGGGSSALASRAIGGLFGSSGGSGRRPHSSSANNNNPSTLTGISGSVTPTTGNVTPPSLASLQIHNQNNNNDSKQQLRLDNLEKHQEELRKQQQEQEAKGGRGEERTRGNEKEQEEEEEEEEEKERAAKIPLDIPAEGLQSALAGSRKSSNSNSTASSRSVGQNNNQSNQNSQNEIHAAMATSSTSPPPSSSSPTPVVLDKTPLSAIQQTTSTASSPVEGNSPSLGTVGIYGAAITTSSSSGQFSSASSSRRVSATAGGGVTTPSGEEESTPTLGERRRSVRFSDGQEARTSGGSTTPVSGGSRSPGGSSGQNTPQQQRSPTLASQEPPRDNNISNNNVERPQLELGELPKFKKSPPLENTEVTSSPSSPTAAATPASALKKTRTPPTTPTLSSIATSTAKPKPKPALIDKLEFCAVEASQMIEKLEKQKEEEKQKEKNKKRQSAVDEQFAIPDSLKLKFGEIFLALGGLGGLHRQLLLKLPQMSTQEVCDALFASQAQNDSSSLDSTPNEIPLEDHNNDLNNEGSGGTNNNNKQQDQKKPKANRFNFQQTAVNNDSIASLPGLRNMSDSLTSAYSVFDPNAPSLRATPAAIHNNNNNNNNKDDEGEGDDSSSVFELESSSPFAPPDSVAETASVGSQRSRSSGGSSIGSSAASSSSSRMSMAGSIAGNRKFVSQLALSSFQLSTHDEPVVVPVDVDAALMQVRVDGFTQLSSVLEERGAFSLFEVANDYICKILQIIALHGGEAISFNCSLITAVFYFPKLENSVRAAVHCSESIVRELGVFNVESQIGAALRAASSAVATSSSGSSRSSSQGETVRKKRVFTSGTSLCSSVGICAGSVRSTVFRSSTVRKMQQSFHLLSGEPMRRIDHVLEAASPGEVTICKVVADMVCSAYRLDKPSQSFRILAQAEQQQQQKYQQQQQQQQQPSSSGGGGTNSGSSSRVSTPGSRSLPNASSQRYQPVQQQPTTQYNQQQPIDPLLYDDVASICFSDKKSCDCIVGVTLHHNEEYKNKIPESIELDIQDLASHVSEFIPPKVQLTDRRNEKERSSSRFSSSRTKWDHAETRLVTVLYLFKTDSIHSSSSSRSPAPVSSSLALSSYASSSLSAVTPPKHQIDLRDWVDETQRTIDAHNACITQICDDHNGVYIVAAINLQTAERSPAETGIKLARALTERHAGCTIGLATGLCFASVCGSDFCCRYEISPGWVVSRAAAFARYAIRNRIPVAVGQSVVDFSNDASLVSFIEQVHGMPGITSHNLVVNTNNNNNNNQNTSTTTTSTTVDVFGLSKVDTTILSSITTPAGNKTSTVVHEKKFIAMQNHIMSPHHASSSSSSSQPQQRLSVLVHGLSNSGKFILCSRVAYSNRIVGIVHVSNQDSQPLDLLFTLASWFHYSHIEEIQNLSSLVMRALKQQHLIKSVILALQLVDATIKHGLRTAIIVRQAQRLDAMSVSFLRQSVSVDSEKGTGRWLVFVTVVPQFGAPQWSQIAAAIHADTMIVRVGHLTPKVAASFIKHQLNWDCHEQLLHSILNISGMSVGTIDAVAQRVLFLLKKRNMSSSTSTNSNKEDEIERSHNSNNNNNNNNNPHHVSGIYVARRGGVLSGKFSTLEHLQLSPWTEISRAVCSKASTLIGDLPVFATITLKVVAVLQNPFLTLSKSFVAVIAPILLKSTFRKALKHIEFLTDLALLVKTLPKESVLTSTNSLSHSASSSSSSAATPGRRRRGTVEGGESRSLRRPQGPSDGTEFASPPSTTAASGSRGRARIGHSNNNNNNSSTSGIFVGGGANSNHHHHEEDPSSMTDDYIEFESPVTLHMILNTTLPRETKRVARAAVDLFSQYHDFTTPEACFALAHFAFLADDIDVFNMQMEKGLELVARIDDDLNQRAAVAQHLLDNDANYMQVLMIQASVRNLKMQLLVLLRRQGISQTESSSPFSLLDAGGGGGGGGSRSSSSHKNSPGTSSSASTSASAAAAASGGGGIVVSNAKTANTKFRTVLRKRWHHEWSKLDVEADEALPLALVEMRSWIPPISLGVLSQPMRGIASFLTTLAVHASSGIDTAYSMVQEKEELISTFCKFREQIDRFVGFEREQYIQQDEKIFLTEIIAPVAYEKVLVNAKRFRDYVDVTLKHRVRRIHEHTLGRLTRVPDKPSPDNSVFDGEDRVALESALTVGIAKWRDNKLEALRDGLMCLAERGWIAVNPMFSIQSQVEMYLKQRTVSLDCFVAFLFCNLSVSYD